ncbi:type IV toxin-antitoxin system AbiEi family antitoxin [Egicoccus sp. AB-alg6-2]|uniref:type IV toxin-antitoxin system AbiEi family antitoxin n=1 Tax=Egicoccus sp. AB-alg6-2 TaxID=3242692 RepID=UPI00359EA03E
MPTVDERAQEFGREQYGRVTRRQLREQAGVSDWTIRHRLTGASWNEPHPGVIDLRTHTSSWRGQVMEVLLLAGDDAWASHRTAAHLHQFLDVQRPDRIEVVVPRGRNPRIRSTRFRTTSSIGADEVTEVHRLRCTTPARTLLDLASCTAPRELERLLADRLRRDRGLLDELLALADRHRHVPGRRRLLDVAARLPSGSEKLGSPLEVAGVQRLRRLGAPPFVLQFVVRGPGGERIKRVDVAWPERMTLLEFDGAAYHDLSAARREDARVRDRMRALGWHVEVARRADLDGPALAGFVRRLRAG